jgi:hypothetical protein
VHPVGDLVLGLALAALALFVRARRRSRSSDQFGVIVTIVLTSFGLAVLMFEGLLPGLWMIVGYALHGGTLEDHLLPGASVGNLLRALAIGLVVSAYAAGRAYALLLRQRR